jgi:phosphatidylserine/phosphatidylglycerophosphate/cardiolipin synthase-like enzyme
MFPSVRRLLLIIACYVVGILSWIVLTNGSAPLSAALHPQSAPPTDDGIIVLFSPSGGCTNALVEEINHAGATLDVQAYLFSSNAIAKAVGDAHARGVKVRVVLDPEQKSDRLSAVGYLLGRSVPLWIDEKHAISHNKVMLIDGKVVVTGSFNFTRSAEERNAENLLIIRNHPKLMAAYQANFELHFSHSVALTAAAKPATR